MQQLRKRLDRLHRVAAVLESSSAERKAAFAAAGRHSETFLESLPTRSAYQSAGPRDEAMHAFAIGESPAPIDQALETLAEYVDGIGHNLGSSRFFAYIPSGGLYASALADYLAAVSNRYAGVGAAAPGATRMEESILRWLADMVGYPESAEGDLTSGGSMAALSAIVAAREAHGLGGENVARAIVYQTAHTHHTFRKALHIAGLGSCVLRDIPLDSNLRMDAAALERQIKADRGEKLHPWLIAASAGTTDAGAIDPLPAIADIAQDHGAWLHLDAAYGGPFALCGEGRKRLAGIERTDSLILDPHKGFFLPCGSGVVLVRDGRKLFEAYHARGTYMQDVEGGPERSPCDFSAELTRPSRALRFWLPFKIHGSAPFAAALEEKLLLAQVFYDEVQRIPGIDVGPAPDLSVVTFRLRGPDDETDNATRALLEAIHRDDRVFMASTRIAGKFTIRMAILTYNTHIDDVELALDVIRECAAAIRAA
tara:strand:- start:1609 stop:3057 length:1449 start_codon:yes stop_codon:yes gene_type:complete